MNLDYFINWTESGTYFSGIKIMAIIAGAYLTSLIATFLIDKIIRRTVRGPDFTTIQERKRRSETLVSVFNNTLNVFLIIIVGIMLLSELGVQTGPLIAFLSLFGIALGLGAQFIIRDIFTGFFIILENQYRIGDVVCVGKTCGLVEGISLRETILRDDNGTVHHVSNGEIRIASNLSKFRSNINLTVSVTYESDIEKVIRVINRVGKDFARGIKWKDKITSPPQFQRIEDFAQSGIVMKILGETRPLMQWDATGELRKRLKIAFDKNKIQLALPQLVIHQQVNQENTPTA